MYVYICFVDNAYISKCIYTVHIVHVHTYMCNAYINLCFLHLEVSQLIPICEAEFLGML